MLKEHLKFPVKVYNTSHRTNKGACQTLTSICKKVVYTEFHMNMRNFLVYKVVQWIKGKFHWVKTEGEM